MSTAMNYVRYSKIKQAQKTEMSKNVLFTTLSVNCVLFEAAIIMNRGSSDTLSYCYTKDVMKRAVNYHAKNVSRLQFSQLRFELYLNIV
jgi:hypothetical protein